MFLGVAFDAAMESVVIPAERNQYVFMRFHEGDWMGFQRCIRNRFPLSNMSLSSCSGFQAPLYQRSPVARQSHLCAMGGRSGQLTQGAIPKSADAGT